MVVNYEYINPELMFKDYFLRNQPTKEEVDFMIQAHGLSIVEIKKNKVGFEENHNPISTKFNWRIALMWGPKSKLLQ